MGAFKVFKMIVAYDGTRYHGFQRQIDNASMMKIIQILRRNNPHPSGQPQQSATATGAVDQNSETEDSKAFVLERPTKRPKYELDGSRKKHSKLSIQQILEMVCMDLVSSSTTTKTQSPMEVDDDDKDTDAKQRLLFSIDDLCLKFAGRTDRGVHAAGQVITVQLPQCFAFASSSPWKKQACTRSASVDIAPGNCRNKSEDVNKTNNEEEEEEGNAFCFWLCKSINSRLPLDVSVQNVECLGTAPIPFDPRRHVRRKQYTYTIKYQRRQRSPNWQDFLFRPEELGPYAIRHALDSPVLWVCPWSLDDSQIPALCEKLRGTHDYRNFVHKHVRDQTDQMLTIDRIDYEILHVKTDIYRFPKKIHNGKIVSTSPNENNNAAAAAEMESTNVDTVTGRFVFEAAGFRRTMLRNIVGYIVDQCRAKDDENVIRMKDNDPFGDDMTGKINAAPASGLCLESVTY
jgi:tRNA U38,U39,U40 pseudouridine synthase TruA